MNQRLNNLSVHDLIWLRLVTQITSTLPGLGLTRPCKDAIHGPELQVYG